jgi:hypothetical protein
MTKPILISAAVLLSIATVIGWSFELPRLEETVGVYHLLFKAALIGGALGTLLGFILAVKERRFIAKFQAFASSLLLFTFLTSLIAHWSNRYLTEDQFSTEQLRVKQVTATWKDRGLSRQELSSPPDGYYIFVETDEGTIRLLREGSAAPDIGPSRTIEVRKQDGYWGYPLYSILPDNN